MSIWLNHLVLFIQISLIMFANYGRLCIESNKLLVHGIMSWKVFSYLLVFLMLNQLHLYLFMLMMAWLFICLSKWMILFSLVIIPPFLQVLFTSYLQGFPVKILSVSLLLGMGCYLLKSSTFKMFFLVPECLMLRKFTLLFPPAPFISPW